MGCEMVVEGNAGKHSGTGGGKKRDVDRSETVLGSDVAGE